MDEFGNFSIKHISIVMILEIVFLAFCFVFIGHGVQQWKKKKQITDLMTAATGFVMIVMSLYATKLLLNF